MVPERRTGRALRTLLAGVLCISWGLPAWAWVYPEHRDIAVTSVTGLDAARRAVFDRLWEQARQGDETRLCGHGADPAQSVAPPCIDWAALSGLAGDHSCSSAELLAQVRQSDWVLVVADIAAQLKEDLARIPAGEPQERGATDVVGNVRQRLSDGATRARRLNALRTANTRLQRADPRYALRADSNLAHFLLPRSDTRLDPLAYAGEVLRSGAPLNAGGVYVWHHLSALQKAAQLADPSLSAAQRAALSRAALFDEAFALHFLQDMFAAGHIAGSWGDVSQRMGTHDYYNENGLEVFTWRTRSHSSVVMGDAHMRAEDQQLAAALVRSSLVQVLDAATGRGGSAERPSTIVGDDAPEALDVCRTVSFPDRSDRLGKGLATHRSALEEVLLDTFIPGLSPGLGAQPRSRSELGLFAGLVGSAHVHRINRGFDVNQNEPGRIEGLQVGLRVGFGLEGALGDAGDGLTFLQLGYRADGASSNRLAPLELGAGNLLAAVPARSGVSLRLRMPFFAVPGDLLLTSPLYLVDRERYTGLAVGASNGGLLGLQRGYATRFGRFQFVLGRELGITWYGLDNHQQLLLLGGPNGTVLRFRSVSYELPIIDYRPFRTFSADQSSTLLFQLVAGIDRPYGIRVDTPGAPPPTLRTIRWLGVRMTFDWRHYF